MESVIQITAVCILVALLILLIRRSNPENALLLSLAVSILSFLFLAGCLREILDFLNTLAKSAGISSALLIPLYKVLGIGLVVRLGSALCRDAGEAALSSVIETAGAVCGLLAALPLFQTVLNLLLELMQ